MSKIEEMINQTNEEIEREEILITKKNSSLKSNLSDKDIEDIRKEYTSTSFKEIAYDLNPVEVPLKIKNAGNLFKREVEKILFLKSEKQKGLKRGVLDATSLWKLGIRDGNVFEKKGARNKDYAFYLLQDGSGSMGGTKEIESATTLSIIEEGLKEYSALKISTFASSGGNVVHYTAKQFDDNRKFNHSYSFLKTRRANGGNKDGFSIRIATKELLKRQEQKKVLFVLSDGLPSQYSSQETALNDVRKAVEEARTKGIEVIAVMFGSDHFIQSAKSSYEYMYQYGIIACNPEDIGRKINPLLKSIIKK